mmetsp:Transcript_69391/g.193102  ORF Transcript_69391/g.193102 Transcript_69391/m.193102 type:complete len:278 (-) Transcript_69391:99-932(-)
MDGTATFQGRSGKAKLPSTVPCEEVPLFGHVRGHWHQIIIFGRWISSIRKQSGISLLILTMWTLPKLQKMEIRSAQVARTKEYVVVHTFKVHHISHPDRWHVHVALRQIQQSRHNATVPHEVRSGTEYPIIFPMSFLSNLHKLIALSYAYPLNHKRWNMFAMQMNPGIPVNGKIYRVIEAGNLVTQIRYVLVILHKSQENVHLVAIFTKRIDDSSIVGCPDRTRQQCPRLTNDANSHACASLCVCKRPCCLLPLTMGGLIKRQERTAGQNSQKHRAT